MLVGPLDSTVKYLNKLTWPRAETKKTFQNLFATDLFLRLLSYEQRAHLRGPHEKVEFIVLS